MSLCSDEVLSVDTDLPDINVVKRASFRAGKTVEGSEVIPKHPECHIMVTGNKENTVLFKLNTKTSTNKWLRLQCRSAHIVQSQRQELTGQWPGTRFKGECFAQLKQKKQFCLRTVIFYLGFE